MRAQIVSLRAAGTRDWSTIDAWLKRPDIQSWWGSHASAQAAVLSALRTDMGLCSLIEVDGEPVGYAQALDADVLDGATFKGAPLDLERGLFRVEAFIGAPKFRGSGVGQQALRLVAEEVFATTLVLGLIAIVALRHEGAVRAYEKAGFQWVRVIDDALLGPCWIMRFDRS